MIDILTAIATFIYGIIRGIGLAFVVMTLLYLLTLCTQKLVAKAKQGRKK